MVHVVLIDVTHIIAYSADELTGVKNVFGNIPSIITVVIFVLLVVDYRQLRIFSAC